MEKLTCGGFGHAIGVALEQKNWARARSLLDQGILHRLHQDTLRDYSEPINDIVQDPRTLGVLEACQVVTVEDFFRTSFEVIQKQQRDSFSPAAKLQSAKTRIENRYGESLETLLSSGVWIKMLEKGILTIRDLRALSTSKLTSEFPDPTERQEIKTLRLGDD